MLGFPEIFYFWGLNLMDFPCIVLPHRSQWVLGSIGYSLEPKPRLCRTTQVQARALSVIFYRHRSLCTATVTFLLLSGNTRLFVTVLNTVCLQILFWGIINRHSFNYQCSLKGQFMLFCIESLKYTKNTWYNLRFYLSQDLIKSARQNNSLSQ